MNETTFLYLHPQGLEEGELSIFGLDHVDLTFIPASIEDLRHDMYQQKRLLAIDRHPDGILLPWSGRLMVAEGYYQWDDHKEDYVFISL